MTWLMRRTVVVLVAMTGMGASQSLAGEGLAGKSLPSGAEVMDRFIEVTGGKSAYQAVHNRVGKGSIEMVEMSIKGPMASFFSAPNLAYIKMEIGGMGEIERGTDGKVGWEKSPMTGARVMQGKEAEFVLRESLFNAELQWRKVYSSVENMGEEKDGDKSYYKIKATPISGPPKTLYYNVSTGLLDRMKFVVATQGGDMPIEVLVEDYRKVGGILMSFKSTQKVSGQTMRMTLESIEVNVKLAPDQFALPDDIKALLAKKEAAAKSKDTEKTGE